MDEETYEGCSLTKRRKLSTSSSSRWSELHDDILVSLLRRLSRVDVVRFSAVCTSWLKVVQSQKSSSSFTPTLEGPWLILPPEEEEDIDEAKDSCCFFSLEENKLYYKNKKIFKGFGKSHCIGSSHGWLVILDERADPYLLNPLTRERIKLPSLTAFEDVVGINKSGEGSFVWDSSDPSKKLFMSVQQLQESFIQKAILSADPDPLHSEDFGVIMIYNNKSKIAFWKCGNSAWKDLHDASGPYHDIMCNNNQVFALSSQFSVEVWDFSKYHPTKKMKIETFQPEDLLQTHLSMFPLYSNHWYLAESMGHVLLVSRILSEFLNEYDQPVLGSDPLNIQAGLLPYKTLQFNVYKLDFNLKQWVKMDSLGDCILFLGGNHSMSLSTRDFPQLKNNSIYFTDDHWNQINKARSFGGHDMGVFNLEEKSIKPISHFGKHGIHPPPFWFVPNPWQRKN